MKLIFTMVGILLSGMVLSQRCGNEVYQQTVGTKEPVLPNAKGNPMVGVDTVAGRVVVVPVVIHLLYNTNAQNISEERIISQINALNRDFRRQNSDTIKTPAPFRKVAADVQIVFQLAKKDPSGNYTNGIIRKYTRETVFLPDDQMKFSSTGGDDAWDASKYLNIWVCNLFGRTLAYTPMPGCDPKHDGIVIQYGVFGAGAGMQGPYSLGRTLTHEAGHWLGLKHLWGDEACGDDGIADTPPQQAPNLGCNNFPKLSACSANGNGDMFMNFMDFSDDACLNMFTQGQKKEMRGQFAKGGFRNSILSSDGLENSLVQEGPIDKEWKEVVRIYPNPISDQVTVEGRSFNEVNGKYLKVYDLQGRMIRSLRIQAEKTVINMTNLPAGMYLLSFEEMGKREMFKIVKVTSGASGR